MKDITVIIGPTGIGKSDHAIQLALKTGAEIISADAFQVYKGMDIGTGKITKSEQNKVPHHLIDILTPDQPFDVTQFISRTNTIIQSLRSQNKPIIICGGTGLYVNAFLYNYTFPPIGENPEIRKKLETSLEIDGPQHLWNTLQRIDPDSAAKIPHENSRRVIRALEIYELTGKKASEIQHKHDKIRTDTTLIGLHAKRDIVIKRINTRIDKMITLGLINEVKQLLSTYPPDCKAFEALGYKETIAHLHHHDSLDTLIELIKTRTRQFAKRQMTWFNKLPDVQWLEIER